MKTYKYSFEKLKVWHLSRAFVKEIYKITKEFPDHEKYGLTNQIRRATVSISANITEGSSRLSPKDKAHFYQIAYSSLTEVLNHLYLALDLDYITKEILEELKSKLFEISNKLNSLRNPQLKK